MSLSEPRKNNLTLFIFLTITTRILIEIVPSDKAKPPIYLAMLIFSLASIFNAGNWKSGASLYRDQLILAIIWIASVCSIAYWIPIPDETLRQKHSWPPLRDLVEFAVVSFAVAVVEETIFRKSIIEALTPRIGTVFAILASSTIFTVLNNRIFPAPFISSIIYCHISITFRSIFLAVFLHFSFNFLGHLALALGASKTLSEKPPLGQWVILIRFFAEVGVFVSFYLSILVRKYFLGHRST